MSAGSHLNAVKGPSARVRMTGAESTEPREKDDFYATPRRGIEALLQVESFHGAIWEPACGDGAISKVLRERGHDVVSTDLVNRGFGDHGVDFLMEWQPRTPNIVTNPPFKLAVPFVRKALQLTEAYQELRPFCVGGGAIAMLLMTRLLHGQDRFRLWTGTPLAAVWIFSKPQTFSKNGENVTFGTLNGVAWFVWRLGWTAPPRIGWLL